MNRQCGLICALAILALCVVAGNAAADTYLLTFEGLQNYEPIADYYNGGLGGFGSGPGPNYGITFGSDSLAIIESASGGSGNFYNEPSRDTIAFFTSGPGVVMNVAAGFNTEFSTYYSAAYYPGTITVWDGPDATGSLLASLNLPVTPTDGSGYIYDNWQDVNVFFNGTARSVDFGGTANYIGFDNVKLGAVPEPTTMALMAMGLVGLIAKRKRAG
jgi:hypothetical protein